MDRPDQIRWCEPWWPALGLRAAATTAATRRLSSRVLRITALSALVAGALVAFGMWAFPPGTFVVPWGLLVQAMVPLPLGAAVAFMTGMLLPRTVTLTGEYLFIYGQFSRRIDRDRIRALALAADERGRVRLLLDYEPRPDDLPIQELIVGRRVNLEALTRLVDELNGSIGDGTLLLRAMDGHPSLDA